MSDDSNDKKPFWITGERTRRHSYFYPRNNFPGILLFGVIAVLGCVALVVSIRHIIVTELIQQPYIVLMIIGLIALVLGIYQGWRLWCSET